MSTADEKILEEVRALTADVAGMRAEIGELRQLLSDLQLALVSARKQVTSLLMSMNGLSGDEHRSGYLH